MKKFLTIMSLALIGLSVHGQPEDYKGYFGLSAGLALPVGDFASTAAGNDQAGYANAGFSAYLSSNIEIVDFIGFSGMIGISNNPYDEVSFTDNYRQQYPGINYGFSSDPYQMFNILGGVYISLPQGILELNFKGYIGVSVGTLPATSSETLDTPNIVLETGKATSTDFIFGGGLNVMVYAGKNIAVIVDAVYLHSNPEFNAVEIRVYEDGQLQGLSGFDFQQKFQMIILDVGLAFTF